MIIVLLISIFGVMLAYKTIYRNIWEKGLFVKFSFEQPYAYVGESVQLNEIIENRKRMPVAPLEVNFRVKKGLLFEEFADSYVSEYVYKRDIFALMGKRRITRSTSVLCEKRGIYSIEDVSFLANSLMFYQTYRKELKTDTQFYVYAKRTNVEDILNAITKISDLMKDNQTSEKKDRMMIYLDLKDIKEDELKEEVISITASLYQELLNKGAEVGICINLFDEKKEKIFCLHPSCNERHRIELEQILASEWKENLESDFEKALQIEAGDAIPVIISKNISSDKIQLGEKLCRENNKGIWVVPHEMGEISSVHSDCFQFIEREVY